jgi:hypothetical protein
MATKFRKFEVGQKVKLTGKFLKSTGQGRGSAGLDTWTITGITSNGWAITDEPTDTSYYTAAELAEDPTLKFRRIALANLYIVGQIDSRNCV